MPRKQDLDSVKGWVVTLSTKPQRTLSSARHSTLPRPAKKMASVPGSGTGSFLVGSLVKLSTAMVPPPVLSNTAMRLRATNTAHAPLPR